jgi:hypothetical protein
MDKTLLLLLILSGVLVALFAPHATFTLVAVIALSMVTTRAFWAIFQSFEETGGPREVLD